MQLLSLHSCMFLVMEVLIINRCAVLFSFSPCFGFFFGGGGGSRRKKDQHNGNIWNGVVEWTGT